MNCRDCEHYILSECEGIFDAPKLEKVCFLDNQYGLASDSKDLALMGSAYGRDAADWTPEEVEEALLKAVLGHDVHMLKTESKLFPYWNLRRAISVTHQLEMYQRLNVNLRLGDVRAESFYAGIPNLTPDNIRAAKEYLRG